MTCCRTFAVQMVMFALFVGFILNGLKTCVAQQAEAKSNPLSMVCMQQGNRTYLYVSQKADGLVVYESTRGRISELKRFSKSKLGGMDAMNVTRHKNHLFIALGDFFKRDSFCGFAILNIATPRDPKLVSVWKSKEKMEGAAAIVANDRQLFLGVMSKGVMAFDISNKSKPAFLSLLLPDIHFPRKNPGRIQMPNARGLFLDSNLLYVAFDAGGLRILNVANPKKMVEVGRYVNSKMGSKQQAYNNLVVHNGFAFVGIDYAGVEILDVRDAKKIKQVSWWNPWNADTLKNLWFNSPGHVNEIRLDPKAKKIYVSAGDMEVVSIDVSNIRQPKRIKEFGQSKNKKGVWGIGLTDDKVFATYIKTIVPFQGQWSGIQAFKR